MNDELLEKAVREIAGHEREILDQYPICHKCKKPLQDATFFRVEKLLANHARLMELYGRAKDKEGQVKDEKGVKTRMP